MTTVSNRPGKPTLIDLSGYTYIYRPRGHGEKIAPASTNDEHWYPARDQNMNVVFGEKGDGTFDAIIHENPNGFVTNWRYTTKWLEITWWRGDNPTVTVLNFASLALAIAYYKSWATYVTNSRTTTKALFSNFKYILTGSHVNIADTQTRLTQAESVFGSGSVLVRLTNYRTDGFDVNYPDYDNLRAGVASFLSTNSAKTIPYMNGILWDINHTGYDPDDMMVASDGQIYIYGATDMRFTKPTITDLRTTLRSQFDATLDTDFVYIDVVGATDAKLDYSACSVDDSWKAGAVAMLQTFSDLGIMAEGPNEQLCPYVDYVVDVSSPNLANKYPLWNAVWSSVVQVSGWPDDIMESPPGTPISAVDTLAQITLATETYGCAFYGSHFQSAAVDDVIINDAGYSAVRSYINA